VPGPILGVTQQDCVKKSCPNYCRKDTTDKGPWASRTDLKGREEELPGNLKKEVKELEKTVQLQQVSCPKRGILKRNGIEAKSAQS